jgi:hypothetical protein
MSNHSPLRRTSSRSGESSRAFSAWVWNVAAFASIADDEDHQMALVLKLAQLAQRDRVAEVDVGRGRVDAELDP